MDTLFYFTLFCYFRSVKIISNPENFAEYEQGQNVIHFRFLDMLSHDCPDVTTSAEQMGSEKLCRLKRERTHEYVGLFTVMGIYRPTQLTRKYLGGLNHSADRALEKFDRLSQFAEEWMHDHEIKQLQWTRSSLSGQVLFL